MMKVLETVLCPRCGHRGDVEDWAEGGRVFRHHETAAVACGPLGFPTLGMDLPVRDAVPSGPLLINRNIDGIDPKLYATKRPTRRSVGPRPGRKQAPRVR